MLGDDGVIHGVFTNGLMRDLGRVPVAVFVNNEGLEEVGGNLFKQTASSGQAAVVNAGTGGAGRTVSRVLEQSNVDMTEQLVMLMSSQRNYQANTKVIATQNEMMQSLMQAV